MWIFDPYEAHNVWRTSITSTTEVDDAITIIRARVISAAASWSANGSANGSSDGKAKGKPDGKSNAKA